MNTALGSAPAAPVPMLKELSHKSSANTAAKRTQTQTLTQPGRHTQAHEYTTCMCSHRTQPRTHVTVLTSVFLNLALRLFMLSVVHAFTHLNHWRLWRKIQYRCSYPTMFPEKYFLNLNIFCDIIWLIVKVGFLLFYD